MQAPTYTITDMAREFDLTLRALRFYEGRGLLAPRRSGLVRIYSEADRERLRMIAQRRAQGFTVTEIKAALDGVGFAREKLVDQIGLLRQQRADIDKAIADLEMQVAA